MSDHLAQNRRCRSAPQTSIAPTSSRRSITSIELQPSLHTIPSNEVLPAWKIQCLRSDRISTLPQNIIERILTLMPIRDAVRTSILSRKWRNNWVKIPKLVFDDKIVVGSRNKHHMLGKHKNLFAINQVLLMHKGPILEFTLSMARVMNFIEIDQIILHLSRNTALKKFTLNAYDGYKLPSSFYSLQQLAHLNLLHCKLHPTSSFYSLEQLTHLNLKWCDFQFQPPSTFNGYNTLTSLYLYDVIITDPKMLLSLISGCPVLKHFTLRGLHIKSAFQEESITVDQLFKCLNVIEYLNFSYYSAMWFFTGGIPRKLSTSLVHLKHLDLSDWSLMRKDEFCFTLLLIRSSPNLEKIKIESYPPEDVMEEIMVFNVLKDYADVKLDHLIEFEIENFSNSIAESELLKLILVKSSMLKKVYLKLEDIESYEEEIKMLRSFLRLPRASPVEILVR